MWEWLNAEGNRLGFITLVIAFWGTVAKQHSIIGYFVRKSLSLLWYLQMSPIMLMVSLLHGLLFTAFVLTWPRCFNQSLTYLTHFKHLQRNVNFLLEASTPANGKTVHSLSHPSPQHMCPFRKRSYNSRIDHLLVMLDSMFSCSVTTHGCMHSVHRVLKNVCHMKLV